MDRPTRPTHWTWAVALAISLAVDPEGILWGNGHQRTKTTSLLYRNPYNNEKKQKNRNLRIRLQSKN